ncbi:MAG: hypothetical protein AAFX56_10300 [Pseudomonadota bacterium]
MQMTIHTQGFPMSSAVYRRAREQFGRALNSFRDSIVDVDVFLKDVNGPKGGDDKAVLVRVNLTTQKSVAIETVNSNLHAALILSARRAKRAVKRGIAKHRRVERQEVRDWRQAGANA